MSGPEGLGKYRFLAEIGHGGMADVYLAVVQGTAGFNKLVVVKKTRAHLADEPEFLTMFLDEARLAARLNHPNVVQTYEVGQEGDRYFIAMEFLDGQPLNRVRGRHSAPMSIPMQVRVVCDLLAGLHYAHELTDFDGSPLGIVHRDATPQNIFLTYDGGIKVVDFGIAKAADSSGAETRTGVLKGKVPYMSPEQARSQKVDRRSDIFAAGVMLWEGIVGKRMWKGVTDIKVLQELLGGEIPNVRERAPNAPEPLARICDRALAVDREQRYATAHEMQEDLEGWLGTINERPSARDVGKFIAEKFAAERAAMKSVIETQLRDVRWTGTNPRVSSANLPKVNLDAGPPSATFDAASLAASLAQQGLTPATGSSLAAATSGVTGGEPPRPASRTPILVLGAGVVMLGAAIAVALLLFVPRRGASDAPTVPEPKAAATVQSPPPVSPASAPAPGQPAVHLTVRVTPADARIFLDDVLLGAGTFEGKVLKSDAPHKVRAEAPHHASQEQDVSLTEDAAVAIVLEAETTSPAGHAPASPPPASPHGRGKPAAPPSAAAAPPPPPEPPAAAPPAGQRQKRTIDSTY